MPDAFLHERSDFKARVETAAESEKIDDPALVEKDCWIMPTVFGLKAQTASHSVTDYRREQEDLGQSG